MSAGEPDKTAAARAGAGDAVLNLEKLSMRFGGLTAVSDFEACVKRGEIFSIIGPNGAGKTTIFNALTGIYPPSGGCVKFCGAEPCRRFTAATAIGMAAIGALTAAGAVIVMNLEPMWAATVTENFVYEMPFPYGEAWRDLFGFLNSLTPREGLIPALCGAVLGVAGAAAVWMRGRRAPEVVSRKGIARTFQNIRLFREMTALENVLVALDAKLHSQVWDVVFRLPRYWREDRRAREEAMELLKFVDVDAFADQAARNLPYGHQRRLEIARALATRPELLLLDEPAAGMNPSETVELMDLIRRIRGRGVTVVLIEHDMRVVMGISDRIAVLDYGNKIAEGAPAEIKANPRVIEAYLGKEVVG